MKIIYYADDASMGDTDHESCEKFRQWALDQLQEAYPDFEIEVKNEPSLHEVKIVGLPDEVEITDFSARLWERCPWNRM